MDVDQTAGEPGTFSDREAQVLHMVVLGLTMKEIARHLGIAARTVAFHKYAAMARMGWTNNRELIRYWLIQYFRVSDAMTEIDWISQEEREAGQ